MKTITLAQLLDEVKNYKTDLPVFIRVNDIDYPIDDIMISMTEKMQYARITIETWHNDEFPDHIEEKQTGEK